MPDQVAWVMIARGWKVISSDGVEIGLIDERVGDENVDIFDGLAISTSVLGRKTTYVPSEQVGAIYEGEVHLKVTQDQVARLADFTEPPPSAIAGAEPSSDCSTTRLPAAAARRPNCPRIAASVSRGSARPAPCGAT